MLGPQFQVEALAKSVKQADVIYRTITKKKGGMLDPGRCRVMFDHRGQIIAKPSQTAGYSTDTAEEDAIEIGMLTKKAQIFNDKRKETRQLLIVSTEVFKSTARWR